MDKKIYIIFYLLVTVVFGVAAQTDFKQSYFSGKDFFRGGKYNLAMESFKKAIPYDPRNPYSEYASFYYALSAYNQGYKAVAKDMLNQLKSLYPKWDKMDDVNLWLAKIHFDNKDYFQGLKVLSIIQDKKLQPDMAALKQKAIKPIPDVETLRMMSEEYPKDEIIAKALAKNLAKNPDNEADRALLESLIDKFNFSRTDFIPEIPQTFFKDTYSVSVLFPFLVKTLDPSPTKKRNQIVLDLYEGMKLAVDTLAKLSIHISLRAYDTERNIAKIKKILDTDELRNTDLIVGPIYPEENKIAQDFSFSNHINIINPVSNNSENLQDNLYAFLFQPSYETLGKKSADFLNVYSKKKNCMVFYGATKRDSVLAANFIQRANEDGLKILSSQKIHKESASKILTMLATPTEYDEFKYPKEFTLKKDSVGSIFVATDDALIYSKVLSSVETRGDSIMVVGSERWLEQADFEKYQRLGIVLAAPEYTSLSNRSYKTFVKKFIRTHGCTPSNFSKLGYEFMMFAGQQLKKNGVYFQEAFDKENFIPGVLSEGYNFQLSHDNQRVPFVKFEKGELIMIRYDKH